MQWWCSATGEPWTWSWQAYPGVWLFVALFGWLTWRVLRRETIAPHARAAAAAGIVLLWLTLDWPVGPLGTGYLASVHALQFISLAMVVPPLLLRALPRDGVADVFRRSPRLESAVAALTHPLAAALLFTVVMIATHVPRVVDAVMGFQLGAFLLDVAWFGSGLVFWWPVVVQRPVRPGFNPILRILYIFIGTQAHLFIAMWLLLADFPVYATYELAPRVTGLSALQDQQLAGGFMIGVAEPIVFAAIALVFFRWAGEQERRARG